MVKKISSFDLMNIPNKDFAYKKMPNGIHVKDYLIKVAKQERGASIKTLLEALKKDDPNNAEFNNFEMAKNLLVKKFSPKADRDRKYKRDFFALNNFCRSSGQEKNNSYDELLARTSIFNVNKNRVGVSIFKGDNVSKTDPLKRVSSDKRLNLLSNNRLNIPPSKINNLKSK